MTVREETKYPDKTGPNVHRSLQLLKKNMELRACCITGTQNLFFISWNVFLNIITLIVGRIFSNDGNLQFNICGSEHHAL